jgi:catechol 2,3-dioxygenase-like lactoylglutathione lyase family enzyme
MKLGAGRDGNTSTDGRSPNASAADHIAPSVLALHHVRVPVTDVLVSQDWYSEVLGFRPTLVVEEENAVTGVVSVHPSGVVVGLHSAPKQAAALAGFAVIGLSVGDLRQWVAHLDAFGVSHSGITDGHLGECLRLRDPDGLVIELHTPYQPSADEA